jgi:cytochrome b561
MNAMSPSSNAKASLLLRSLHWLMALLVVGALGFIYAKGLFDKGSAERGAVEQFHILAGLLIFVLMPLRIVVRRLSPLPDISPPPPRWQMTLAQVMHVLLYLCMIALPILGVLFIQAGGKAVDPFGLFTLPTLIDPDKTLARNLKDIHETVGLGMLYLIIAHAGAALLHHVFQRDNTLQRML